MAPRLELRAQGEAQLEAELRQDADFQRALAELEKQPEVNARRDLLASSVRVTSSMAPKLVSLVEAARETLGVDTAVETYVYPDSMFNAGCLRAENGRVFVMFSSALLEAFDDDELRFVIGHELGHHLFAHHRIPVRILVGGTHTMAGPVVMKLFAWSRYAEISADRAGLVCTSGLEPVARAFFKLASGLRGGLVQMRVEDLVGQLGELRAELEREPQHDNRPRHDWFSTHPFSPLRLRAARAFVNRSSDAALEEEVRELMSIMEPTYLAEKSEPAELMRRLLLAGGVSVAASSGDIDPKERDVLDRFFGAGTTAGVNVKALQGVLAQRARDVKERVPAIRRQQVLRDLTLIARADGHVDEAERALLLDIAEQAGVERNIVDGAMSADLELD